MGRGNRVGLVILVLLGVAWPASAAAGDGDPFAELAMRLRDPFRVHEAGPARIVGLDLARRDREERLLVAVWNQTDLSRAHRLWLCRHLVDLGDLSPTGARGAVAWLAEDVGRPTLRLDRERSANFLARLLPALREDEAREMCRPWLDQLVEQIRQAEEAMLLSDQVRAAVRLRRWMEPRDWNAIVARLRRQIGRDARELARWDEQLVPAILAMEQGRRSQVIREMGGLFVAAIGKANTPEDGLRLATELSELADYLDAPEVVAIGREASPVVAAIVLDAVRLAALNDRFEAFDSQREQIWRIVRGWSPDDVARVWDSFDPRHREHMPRTKEAAKFVWAGQPAPAGEAEALVARFRMAAVRYRIDQLLERRSSVYLDPVIRLYRELRDRHRGEYWDSATAMINWCQARPPAEAWRVLCLALCLALQYEDESSVPVLLVEFLLASLLALSPADRREAMESALPHLVRFCREPAGINQHSRHHDSERKERFHRHLGELLLREPVPVLQREAARWWLRLADRPPIETFRQFLDPTQPEVRVRDLALFLGTRTASAEAGWSLAFLETAARPLPEPLAPSVLVELLHATTDNAPARRAVLDVLERHFGRPFRDHWEFVRYARDQRLPLRFFGPASAAK